MLNLDNLKKALSSLEALIKKTYDEKLMQQLDSVVQDGIKAGVIQNFEFTYELCWKMMKRWLEEDYGTSYLEGISKKELFRLAAENRLIADVKSWIQYHESRNLTSHTYDQNVANGVFQVTLDFVYDARALLEELERRNA